MVNITPDNKLKRLIVVGDRVLIRPKSPSDRTTSGLYLPPTVQEREQVQSGYVIKVGPGYPIPTPSEEEPWKETEERVKYMPLQAQEGDVAIYLQRHRTGIRRGAVCDCAARLHPHAGTLRRFVITSPKTLCGHSGLSVSLFLHLDSR